MSDKSAELVRVYKNLNKKCFSIQRKIDGRWIISEYALDVNLINAKFKVYQAGRKRVVDSGRKNVHAYVVGELLTPIWPHGNSQCAVEIGNWEKVSYDPRRFEQFRYCHNSEFIYEASEAVLTMGGIYVRK